jgi:hypothetical protein
MATRYPRNLREFQQRFADDPSCLAYLSEKRWPNGFRCSRCDSANATLLSTRRVWQCRSCRRQTSLTAGTALHRTRLPLTVWFWAAYLVSSLTPGISARQLALQLGLRYETAWMILHKLRRAMVNPNRERLSGTVEVDETWIGGRQAGLKGGRQRAGRNALMVAVAVERRDKALGRLRHEVVPDDTGPTLTAFVLRNVEPGSTVVSDAWPSYNRLTKRGYKHQPRSQRGLKRAELEGDAVPGVHRVISNLKTWLRGTHHGVGADHLDRYLDEFVFRFNRRFYPMAGFATLLSLGLAAQGPTYEEIRSPLVNGAAKRRRGRSTGQSMARRFSVEVVERLATHGRETAEHEQ